MQLSPHFYLGEFTRSATATRYGYPNTPNKAQIENLKRWALNIGEPIRTEFKKPVLISSGFRGEQLNKRVRGSKTSQHKLGEAADFEVMGTSNFTVANFIANNLDFDQLILEFWYPKDPMSGWIHCSYVSPEKNRHSVLRAVKRNGRTTYLKGLPE